MAKIPEGFNSGKAVISWAKYLVETGICQESDWTLAKMRGANMKVRGDTTWSRKDRRNEAAVQAASLAAKHYNHYVAWCVRERVAGRMK